MRARALENNECRITQTYGLHKSFHHGVDMVKYYSATCNVTAHTEGTVVWTQTGQGHNPGSTGNKSYGNCVKIKHPNGYYTLYAHLARVDVKNGQNVKKGQVIGYMGNTGNSYGAHLHWEVRTLKIQELTLHHLLMLIYQQLNWNIKLMTMLKTSGFQK